MSVAPDFLLQSVPEMRPQVALSKTLPGASESRSDGASSFADVYAQERREKPVERKDSGSKVADKRSDDSQPADDRSSENPPAEAKQGTAAADQRTAVAEGGKSLPSDEGAEGEETVDPLLLMAMTGQLPTVEPEPLVPVELPEATASEGSDPLLQASAPLLAGSAPPLLVESGNDPAPDVLDSLPGLKLALDSAVQNQAGVQQQAVAGKPAQDQALDAEQDFSDTLAAFSADSDSGEQAPLGELKVESLDDGLDSTSSVREGQSDPRAEAFASRLTALSQAINQQSNVGHRLTQVPGQPLQVGSAGMSEAVVDKVMWLSSQNLKSAEIQLDPAELGRLEVRIELNKDQAAQVTFVSANANVRDQLEGQAHRLRELFAQQGMNQLDVNVSDQSMARGSQGSGEEGQRRSAGRGLNGSGDEETLSGVSEIRSPAGGAAPRGLVDYYA